MSVLNKSKVVELKVEHLNVWYSPEFNCWAVTTYDEFGNQIGVTDWYYRKSEAVRDAVSTMNNFEEIAYIKVFTKGFVKVRKIARNRGV